MRGLTRSLASLASLLLLVSLLSLGAFQVSLGATLILLVAPLFSYLAELGLSRTREFSADLAAARLTGKPLSLANALTKLEKQQSGLLRMLLDTTMVVAIPEALRTHPSTRERVRRLVELSHDELQQERRRPTGPMPLAVVPPRRYPSDDDRTRWSVTMT